MQQPNIIFFEINGYSPVKKFLDDLDLNSRAKVIKIINYIKYFGIESVPKYTKKLIETPLWEIRTLGKTNIRILYSTSKNNTIILLHGFIKKTQKTPRNDINIAINRLRKYKGTIE